VVARGVAANGEGDKAEQDKKRPGKWSCAQIEPTDDISDTENGRYGVTAQR
jgi:hypothetical protein